MQIIWKKPDEGNYASGERAWIGKIKVGGYVWDREQGSDNVYKCYLELPGIYMKPGSIRFATEAQARERIEKAIATWFKWLGEA